MKNSEDIESYLIQMNAQYESVGEDIWVVKDTGPEVVISITDPVVNFRAKVVDLVKVPDARRGQLYQKLLELNATDMVHGAYALEEGAVVITGAMQLKNLDFNEFQSTVDDISLALSNHYQTLSTLIA